MSAGLHAIDRNVSIIKERVEQADRVRAAAHAGDQEIGQPPLHLLQLCTRLEGIIPALEPAHALAFVEKLAPTLPKDNLLVMNMCGRGDKDIFAVAAHLGMKM